MIGLIIATKSLLCDTAKTKYVLAQEHCLVLVLLLSAFLLCEWFEGCDNSCCEFSDESFLKKNLEFCHNISIFETAIIDGL